MVYGDEDMEERLMTEQEGEERIIAPESGERGIFMPSTFASLFFGNNLVA
jgi:hypothetical protein